jgi:hypothetical protein
MPIVGPPISCSPQTQQCSCERVLKLTSLLLWATVYASPQTEQVGNVRPRGVPLHRKRSTNPIWRFTPVFGQLASCNGKTKLVVVDNGEAGRKSDGWSMNLKRAAREGQSSAEAGVWRWARCSDICARGVRQLKLRVADLDWWRSVSSRDLKRCPSLQRPTWRSCWPGDAGSE